MHYPQTSKLSQSFQIRYIFTQFYPLIFPKSHVCHFKSKGPTQIYREDWYSRATYSRHSEAIGSAISTIRRTAEATALRLLLTERLKETDTPVVVLGDLNDSQHSNTLNICLVRKIRG